MPAGPEQNALPYHDYLDESCRCRLVAGWVRGVRLQPGAGRFPDPAFTREEWQQRVRHSRHRAEKFISNARKHEANPPPSKKEEIEAARQRALNDPSLQHGDIIATGEGFLVFVR